MSLMAMNRAFKKHGAIWGGLLALLMIVGVVFTGFGSNVSSGGDPAAPTAAGGAGGEIVAKVGTRSVARGDMERRLEMLLQQQAMMGMGGGQVPPVQREQFRYMLLDSIKQEQALIAAATKKGVTVTDAQIEAERQKTWEQVRPNYLQRLELKEGATDTDLDRALAKVAPGMTVERLKQENIPADALRLQLYQTGLTDALKKEIPVNEEELRKKSQEVRVRHILVKSGEGGLPDGQAKAKAEKILAEVKANPAKMPDLAKKFSDDPGSKDKGGLYEWAPASQYVPEFGKASLDAGVGKVFPTPVKTTFGYHIIKSEGVRPPKGWDTDKQKVIDQHLEREAAQKLPELIKAETANVPVEILDPSLKASQFEDEAKTATDEKIKNTKYEQALAELAKVKGESDPYGIVPLRKAAIYQALKKNTEAIAAYEEALKVRNTAETRLTLAQLYMDAKNKPAALAQLNELEKLAVPDIQSQMQVAALYRQAGDKAKADAATKKASDMIQRMQELNAPKPPVPAPAASPVAGKAGAPSSPTAPAAAPSPGTVPSPGASPAATR